MKLFTLFTEICPAGSYFDLDMDSCQFCDVGFYQDMAGAFFCWPCDADETTPGNASVSEASCYGKSESDSSCGKHKKYVGHLF